MNVRIQQRDLPSESSETGGLESFPPLLQRIYAARNITDKNELDYAVSGLLPYQDLSGIESAVELLVEALQQQKRILIVADFDADGATSCALAIRGLRLLGAEDVCYVVPDRFKYGYGLTPAIVEVAKAQAPDLLITVDNGIASVEGVAAAKAMGMQVLVTDHHLPGETLPEADAIVNPNQKGDVFSSKALAGVGVIFYVLLALRARLREIGWFSDQKNTPNLAQLLDLVALGTVADVVPLDRNNRILVSQGMARMRRGVGCPGIRALSTVAKREFEKMTSADLGFAIGPRLNAAGRLADMSLGIECLLTDDEQQATQLARQLDELNQQRRSIGDQMLDQANQVLESMSLEHNVDLPYGLCLFDPEWHQGVVGILASRIKEKLHRPVIVFAEGDEGEIKGSARSVKGVHIRDVLDTVATHSPGLISKFGGHAMAAGLSLPVEHYDAFKSAFDNEVRRFLTETDLQGVMLSDGSLNTEQITAELAETLRYAGPWGQGFPEPLFDGIFDLEEARIVGEKHLKMLLREPGSDLLLDAIAFFSTNQDWPEDVSQVEIAYKLDLNEFRGNRSPQLLVQFLSPVV